MGRQGREKHSATSLNLQADSIILQIIFMISRVLWPHMGLWVLFSLPFLVKFIYLFI